MPHASTVQQWFNAHMGGSLYLPDGWYGRPYDNQHLLTSIAEAGNELSMTLDRNLMLKFEGIQAVNSTVRELIFGPFSKLRFEWSENGKRLTKEYYGGEVKIVSPPG